MKKLLFIMLLVISLPAIAKNKVAVVNGSAGAETFTGTLERYNEHSGTLAIQLSGGATCEGRFTEQAHGKARKGTMFCSDGKSGSYTFVPGSHEGVGYGTLNGQNINFTFEQ
jgi:hypothetical protein